MSDDQTIEKPSEGVRKRLLDAGMMCTTQIGLVHAARAVIATTLQGSMDGVSAAESAGEVLRMLEMHMLNLRNHIESIETGLPFKWENHQPEEIN